MKQFRSDRSGITIQLPSISHISIIENACRSELGWRTPTKKYDTIYDRWLNTSSIWYDHVIVYLSKLGY